jgi:hypothetical protein
MRVYREQVGNTALSNIIVAGNPAVQRAPMPVPTVDKGRRFAKPGTKRAAVLIGLIQGKTNIEIARELECSAALVTRTRNEGAKRGLIAVNPTTIMVRFSEHGDLKRRALAELRQEALARRVSVENLIISVVEQVALHNFFPDILGELD